MARTELLTSTLLEYLLYNTVTPEVLTVSPPSSPLTFLSELHFYLLGADCAIFDCSSTLYGRNVPCPNVRPQVNLHNAAKSCGLSVHARVMV